MHVQSFKFTYYSTPPLSLSLSLSLSLKIPTQLCVGIFTLALVPPASSLRHKLVTVFNCV
jgi:hypothetical protein